MYGYEAPDRRETVQITLKLDRAASERHHDALRTLRLNYGRVCEGDTLDVFWRFDIQYYGNVAKNLEAVESIIDDESIVREASIEELVHGRSVVLDFSAKLTRLIDKLEGNKPCPRPSGNGWLRRVRSLIPGVW